MATSSKDYSGDKKESEDKEVSHVKHNLPLSYLGSSIEYNNFNEATQGSSDLHSNSGVSVTSYGQGQLSGAVYTVPAHGVITVSFKLKIQCVTPDDVAALNKLIRGLLSASKQHEYDELEKKSISGGVSFFNLFGAGVKASYSDTRKTMDKWGLSKEDQDKIVTAMLKNVNQFNTYNYEGTIYNKEYPYSVTGSLFGIVMDCTIRQGKHETQSRYIGKDTHLNGNGGEQLKVVNKLY